MKSGDAAGRSGMLVRCTLYHSASTLMRLLIICMAFSSSGLSLASVPEAQSAAALHAKYLALDERLRHNPFQRALALDSSEASSDLQGDVYALVDHPFSNVSAALNSPAHWCDVMILHINTKYCHAATSEAQTVLTVRIGKKTPQPIDDAYPIEFHYRVAAATPTYLEIQLGAEQGPLSTRDYRIQLQAVPVGSGRTFLHFTYSYAYGMAGKLAMKTYLATVGSGKVGFTITGRQANGQPKYIGGMRGLMERNAMRYYLAIGAYLAAYSAPPALQLQKRLHVWFNGTEQYPRQLREVDRATYLGMKRSEYLRQQSLQ